ncbi:Uncharacterised protein [Klebsiella pneumoniae]|uniref:Uncharacterized protein n=1 Tax=Klebsiella pneumoniae TaxID=573 RepID=A0A3S4KK55_KLEPN|nr:Uncharacterised protein [Klebsiella pneumoniae]
MLVCCQRLTWIASCAVAQPKSSAVSIFGYQPVADSQPIAGDSPLDAALAKRHGFQPRCTVSADRLRAAQIAFRGQRR